MRKKIIAVIGDGKIERNGEEYRLAHETGKALIDAGYRIQTGGLGGVMEAVFAGARESPNYKEGDTVALVPSFDREQANQYADIVIPTGLDVMRNSLVANADAVIAVGGGAGTLSEMAMAWALFRLILAYSNTGGWSAELAGRRIDGRIRYPEIPEDRVYAVTGPEECTKLLEKYIDRYTRSHTGIKNRRDGI